MTNVTPVDSGPIGPLMQPVQLGFQLEEEHILSDTLYSSLSRNAEYTARKTEPRDFPLLTKFITADTAIIFPSLDIGRLCEKSCFSLVLTDRVELGRLIAHASFTDSPLDPVINIDGKRWKSVPGALSGSTAMNTVFMSMFVHNPEVGAETCLTELIAKTFLSCPPIAFIVVECPSPENNGYVGPFMFTRLAHEVTFMPKPRVTKKLIVYSKDILYPHVVVREGREHDLDDLLPLLPLDTEEIEDRFNKTYLSDLIAMSDRNNQSIVAEFDGEAVGMIAVTTDVNYTMLNRYFHLEPFHGLYKPHDDDEVHLEPVASHLLDQVSSSERALHDKFLHGVEHYRVEKVSLTDITVTSSSSGSSLSSSSSDIAQADLFAGLINQSKISSKKVVVEYTVADFFSRGKFVDTHHSQANQVVREGGILKTYVKPALDRADSAEYNDELAKTESQQFKLLEEIQEIFNILEEHGIDLRTVMLDDRTLKVIAEAEDMVNHCIHSYLHRTLIDEKLLPMMDLNEPPESTFVGIPNAVALQIVAMDKKYHIRMLDLIEGAFLNFPNREYCIITTESSAKELPWMKYFVRVMPKKSSVFNRTLFVIHKVVLKSKIRVRRARPTDTKSIFVLVESLFESDKIMVDYECSLCEGNPLSCFIVEVLTHEALPIIGIVIVSPDKRGLHYQVNYDLDHYAYYDLHGDDDHGYVHHFVISPLFQYHTKVIMKEVMRLTKRDCFYYSIYPVFMSDQIVGNQSLLNNLEDWIPLAPRKRIEYSMLNLTDIYDEQRQPARLAQNFINPHSVFHISKKFTFEPKVAVNTRIVFIGASDTAVSCLEKLICCSSLDFKSVTVISTHGIPGSLPPDEIRDMFFVRRNGPALSMRHDEEWHQRLGLRATVNVVYGTAMKIFRSIKVVVVNDKKVVPYDLLVLTCGRQFIRPDCPLPELVDEKMDKFKEATSKSDRPYGRKSNVPRPLRRSTPRPKNVFVINTDLDAVQALNYLRTYTPYITRRQLIIHGACLEAYCAIKALLGLGIDCTRIIVVTTPGDEMSWERFHSYRDTPKLREVMNETLTQLGIRVINNYNFRRWNVNEKTGICTRVYFGSPTEINERISISCFAYFGYAVRRVGDEIASALIQSFVAYHEGILINTNFETSDPCILAAGPATIYEKRLCAEELGHSHFNSYEVGRVLADVILKKAVPSLNESKVTVVEPGKPELPPLLTEPIVRYAELPGNWHYMHMGRPGWIPSCCTGDCTCEDCECGTEVITGSTQYDEDRLQKYFRLFLNAYQRVEALECVSRVRFPPACFTSLYGHHEAFLNKLVEHVDKEEVRDLYDYFCQPWISALCHDRWLSFRDEVQELFAHYQIGPDIKISNFIRDYLDNLDKEDCFKVDSNIIRHIFDSTGLKGTLESMFLEFLKYNRTSLPMYARPDFVEEVYEERLASPLYLPQQQNF